MALWLNGMLPAFLQQLSWLSHNYSSVNVMPTAPSSVDIGRCFKGPVHGSFRSGCVWSFASRFRLCFRLLPLRAEPPIGQKPRTRNPLLTAVGECPGRVHLSAIDIAHLAYVAALPYAATGILIYRLLPKRPRAWLTSSMAVWAVVFALQVQLPSHLRPFHTAVGDVRASASEAPVVEELLSRVRPHQSLFVYPISRCSTYASRESYSLSLPSAGIDDWR